MTDRLPTIGVDESNTFVSLEHRIGIAVEAARLRNLTGREPEAREVLEGVTAGVRARFEGNVDRS